MRITIEQLRTLPNGLQRADVVQWTWEDVARRIHA